MEELIRLNQQFAAENEMLRQECRQQRTENESVRLDLQSQKTHTLLIERVMMSYRTLAASYRNSPLGVTFSPFGPNDIDTVMAEQEVSRWEAELDKYRQSMENLNFGRHRILDAYRDPEMGPSEPWAPSMSSSPSEFPFELPTSPWSRDFKKELFLNSMSTSMSTNDFVDSESSSLVDIDSNSQGQSEGPKRKEAVPSTSNQSSASNDVTRPRDRFDLKHDLREKYNGKEWSDLIARMSCDQAEFRCHGCEFRSPMLSDLIRHKKERHKHRLVVTCKNSNCCNTNPN